MSEHVEMPEPLTLMKCRPKKGTQHFACLPFPTDTTFLTMGSDRIQDYSFWL